MVMYPGFLSNSWRIFCWYIESPHSSCLLLVFQIVLLFYTYISQVQEVMLSIRNIAALVVALAQFDASQAQAVGYAQCRSLFRSALV